MNLRTVDLNLLVALDAVLKERHVTRAAERIGLSQPAMSNALGRLRRLFNDELLVRSTTGLQLTPRGDELGRSIQPLLRQIARVFDTDAGFAATQSKRTFTIRLSDLLELLLLPRLLQHLKKEAPRLGVDVVHLPPATTVDALERDEVDLAVSMGLEHSSAVRSEPLFVDRMVCVMRKSHPLARRGLTLESFLRQRHLRVAMSPADRRFVDDVLARRKAERQVALNVPHWLIVPHILVRTDLISVMPERYAAAVAGRTLVFRNLPFASDPFEWRLYWHRRHERDPPNAWLRDAVRKACQCYNGGEKSSFVDVRRGRGKP
jgi:DNA-binding transcriptional LysR family regulator